MTDSQATSPLMPGFEFLQNLGALTAGGPANLNESLRRGALQAALARGVREGRPLGRRQLHGRRPLRAGEA